MKIKLFSAAFLITLFLFSGNVNAQVEKYGNDSTECVKNLSLFSVYAKQKSYEDAIGPWRYCFNECPAVHKAIYVNGAKMIKYFIKKNKSDKAVSGAYVDTLMQIYDKRIIHFGTGAKYGKGYILGRKGLDLMRYRKEAVEEAYAYLKESVKLQGKYVEHTTATVFMQASRQMLNLEKIDVAEMADNFMLTIEQLEKFVKFLENCPKGKPEWLKHFKVYSETGKFPEVCENLGTP